MVKTFLSEEVNNTFLTVNNNGKSDIFFQSKFLKYAQFRKCCTCYIHIMIYNIGYRNDCLLFGHILPYVSNKCSISKLFDKVIRYLLFGRGKPVTLYDCISYQVYIKI